MRGLDGRIIPTKSEHGVLNDVLQSDGAIVMKHAHIHAYEQMVAAEIILGRDYEILLDVHDEWQFGVAPKHADPVGQLAAQAITAAGVKLGVRCPLAGEYKVGTNWKETH